MALDGSMNIVQIQHLWWTTSTFMGDCQNRQDISGFAKAITPKFSGSKILVHCQFSGKLICDGSLGFRRNSTQVVDRFLGTDRDNQGSGGYHDAETYSGIYLDDFSATEGTSYTYQMTTIVTGCGDDAYFNRDPSVSDQNGKSSITLFEVSG